MKQKAHLNSVSRTSLIIGLAGLTLAACSGENGGKVFPPVNPTPTPSPVPSPSPTPTPTPTPTPPPTGTAVSPSEAAGQLGGGFQTAFAADPFDEPADADSLTVVAVDPQADPIDITNP